MYVHKCYALMRRVIATQTVMIFLFSACFLQEERSPIALIDESRMQNVQYVSDINLTRDEIIFFADVEAEIYRSYGLLIFKNK